MNSLQVRVILGPAWETLRTKLHSAFYLNAETKYMWHFSAHASLNHVRVSQNCTFATSTSWKPGCRRTTQPCTIPPPGAHIAFPTPHSHAAVQERLNIASMKRCRCVPSYSENGVSARGVRIHWLLVHAVMLRPAWLGFFFRPILEKAGVSDVRDLREDSRGISHNDPCVCARIH